MITFVKNYLIIQTLLKADALQEYDDDWCTGRNVAMVDFNFLIEPAFNTTLLASMSLVKQTIKTMEPSLFFRGFK